MAAHLCASVGWPASLLLQVVLAKPATTCKKMENHEFFLFSKLYYFWFWATYVLVWCCESAVLLVQKWIFTFRVFPKIHKWDSRGTQSQPIHKIFAALHFWGPLNPPPRFLPILNCQFFLKVFRKFEKSRIFFAIDSPYRNLLGVLLTNRHRPLTLWPLR